MRHVETGRGGTRALAFWPDGSPIAVTGAGHLIGFGPAGDPTELTRVPARSAARAALAVHPTGEECVLATEGCEFTVWSRTLNRLAYPGDRARTPAGPFSYFPDADHDGPVRAVAFVGPSRLAFLEGGTVHLVGYDGDDPQPNREFQRATRGAVALAGSPDGHRLAVATDRGIVTVWAGDPPAARSQVKLANRQVPQAMAVNDPGLLTIALADEVRFYDCDTGTMVGSTLTAKPMTGLALAPTQPLLLSHDGGTRVTVWRDLHPLGRYNFAVNKVRAIAIAPDGLTATIGGTARQVAWVDLDF